MTSRNLTSKRAVAVALMITLPWQGVAHAAVALADQPVFASATVPGNLALTLSVEWPTASRTAHTDSYAPTTRFLGYFDPEKCYTYQYNAAPNDTNTGDTSSFQPAGLATNRTCSGKWSGNFLNWAATATIDPFRWAMTGGRRVVDTETETILEKGWHSGQGLFDDRSLPSAYIAGATPLASATNFRIRVNGMGFRMRFSQQTQRLFTVKYWNGTDLSSNANLTNPDRTDNNVSANQVWSGSPRANINADKFSTQFTGTFVAPATGNYKFKLQHDDGARLYVDTTGSSNFTNANRRINNANWTDATNADVTSDIALTAGQSFSVRIDQWDNTGGASVVLSWQLPNATAYTSFSEPLDDGTAFSTVAAMTSANASYDLTMRTKVCDPSAAAGGVETNCKQYANGWKPEGLVQKYANDIRFSAFGYLNDSNELRDGGVMRARQKFVGPTKPMPGQAAVTNAVAEWNATTGVFIRNPDSDDARSTGVSDSGVMNYLNKFGQLSPGQYKNYDPVNELYYAALRYFSNQGNVASWSDISSGNAAQKAQWTDGFPIIGTWDDPILYSCQRNFVLGIGDIYTHRDKNVPGNTLTDHEPAMPAEVSTDRLFDGPRSTGNAKVLQGMGAGLGASGDAVSGGAGRYSTDYMAGLAFEANTKDLRSDLAGAQTVQTYWVDVLEQSFSRNNKFYLAAKFGGLKQSKLKEAGLIDATGAINFDPYTYAGTIPLDWWSTNGEILTDTRNNSTWARPDNYFAAGKPDTMVSGLTQAFASIASNIKNYTTSLSLSTAQPSVTGDVSYSAQYDSTNWSGVVSARGITFNADGTPTVASTPSWTTRTTLENQLGTAATSTGWDSSRRVATWNPEANNGAGGGVPFRLANLSNAQKLALDTTYVSGDDSANYVKWLRGDSSLEGNGYRARSTAGATGLERNRLGDIVNSRVTTVGAPSARLADTSNPGYSTFKEANKNRPLTLYVGANDGMLHAFQGGTATGAGQELFAYVPSVLFNKDPSDTAATDGLLAQLGRPQYAHRNYVDATALAFDIDLARAGRAPQTSDTATSPAPNWHSVLIGGLGKGGRTYYALDITDPTAMSASETGTTGLASKVLWEFPKRSQLPVAAGGTCTTDCVDMGYTFGNPVVVKTKKYGWVVIFGSGYNNTDGKGHLFIVNPANGALLEQMSTGTVASNGMAHPAAYVQDYTDFTADSVYVGDLNGQLWRFDINGTGSYPAPTKIAQLADGSGAAQPITTQPLIQVHPKLRARYVLVGTGRLLDSTDIASGQMQSFYGIADGGMGLGAFAAKAGDGQDFPATRARMVNVTPPDDGSAIPAVTSTAGWYVNLGVEGTGTNAVNWRVISPYTAFSSSVAFSTTLPTGDACNPSGKSRVYAMDFGSGRTKLVDANGNNLSYISVEGVVTDLNFIRVGGKTRLIYGTSKGDAGKAPGDFDERVLRKLLNWREISLE